LAKCWPSIHAHWPKITLHIAGRNTPLSLLNVRLPNVTIHGEVADAAEFINKHAVMIVPLFSGSGMRVKIAEGMILGKVIITTTLGKEGIEGEHKQHFLIADDENQFMQAIQFCVEHPDQAMRISTLAKENAQMQFDSSQAAQKILDIYHMLLGYESRPAGKSPINNKTS
jgi:polysaccharide biosynthesis protein PslH